MNLNIKKKLYYLKEKRGFFISIIILSFFVLPCLAMADGYQLLEPLPIIGIEVSSTGFGAYLAGMFKLSVGLAIVLAVFQLSRGGFTYLTSEAFMKKAGAKEIITNALLGLLIALLAFLLLKFINPDLVNTSLCIPPPGGGGC